MTWGCGHEEVMMFIKNDFVSLIDIAKWEVHKETGDKSKCYSCWKGARK